METSSAMIKREELSGKEFCKQRLIKRKELSGSANRPMVWSRLPIRRNETQLLSARDDTQSSNTELAVSKQRGAMKQERCVTRLVV